ncbi:hypothetical protein DL98DRAFT_613766 [Cadophora sp. DSE1049]|nr:hypothetical protein DL98DRAFT_613766 [Cadophora sp. DSE1049]
MDRNHSIGFAPSFSLVVRHVLFRFGTLVLKILSAIIMILLNTLFGIGVVFSKLARGISSRVWILFFTATERSRSGLNVIRGESEQIQGEIAGEGGVGGRNGVPEGWVRYVICRTEDISEFDLERCEGCRQVLETEIEMPSGKEESTEVLQERLKRVEGWLEEIEKLDRDSGYSSPEADGEVGGEIFWGSPNL